MTIADQEPPRRPAPVGSAETITLQGHYASAVTRLLAFVIDFAVGTGLFELFLAAVAFAVQVLAGYHLIWNNFPVVVAVLGVAWYLLYLAYPWAVSGKTLGMAIVGIKVVATDGTSAGPRRAVVRALTLPLSFLVFGVGFVGIVAQRERRALHDLIAGTAVVYAWDARAARLRFLVRSASEG